MPKQNNSNVKRTRAIIIIVIISIIGLTLYFSLRGLHKKRGGDNKIPCSRQNLNGYCEPGKYCDPTSGECKSKSSAGDTAKTNKAYRIRFKNDQEGNPQYLGKAPFDNIVDNSEEAAVFKFYKLTNDDISITKPAIANQTTEDIQAKNGVNQIWDNTIFNNNNNKSCCPGYLYYLQYQNINSKNSWLIYKDKEGLSLGDGMEAYKTGSYFSFYSAVIDSENSICNKPNPDKSCWWNGTVKEGPLKENTPQYTLLIPSFYDDLKTKEKCKIPYNEVYAGIGCVPFIGKPVQMNKSNPTVGRGKSPFFLEPLD